MAEALRQVNSFQQSTRKLIQVQPLLKQSNRRKNENLSVERGNYLIASLFFPHVSRLSYFFFQLVPANDPLIFYRRIAEIADNHLVTSGLLVIETNESLGEETANLFRAHNFETTLHTDFKGKTRFAVGRKKTISEIVI